MSYFRFRKIWSLLCDYPSTDICCHLLYSVWNRRLVSLCMSYSCKTLNWFRYLLNFINALKLVNTLQPQMGFPSFSLRTITPWGICMFWGWVYFLEYRYLITLWVTQWQIITGPWTLVVDGWVVCYIFFIFSFKAVKTENKFAWKLKLCSYLGDNLVNKWTFVKRCTYMLKRCTYLDDIYVNNKLFPSQKYVHLIR